MSLASSLGRGIGRVGAYAVEGVVRGAAYSGDFATELVANVELGYAEQHAALLVTRAQQDAVRKERIAARKAELAVTQAANPAPVPVPVAVAPKRAKA